MSSAPADGAAATQPATSGARKVYVKSYGCQMNVSDTELVLGILKGAGACAASMQAAFVASMKTTCASMQTHASCCVGL